MNNDELNNETDNLFKKGLENLSEKSPDEREWKKMKSRLEKEGLLIGKTRMRRFLFFVLLTTIGSVTVGLYFINKNSSPVKDYPLKSDRSEVIKNEAPANQSQLTKASSPIPKTTDSTGEIEKKTTAKINREDNANAPIKESAIVEHQINKQTSIASDLNKNILKKEARHSVSTNGKSASQQLPSSPDADRISTVREQGENTDKSSAGKSSSSKNTSQASQDSSTSNNGRQTDTLNGTKIQIDTNANRKYAGDNSVSQADSANNKSLLPHTDSSAIVNDVNPAFVQKKTSERKRFYIGGFFSLDFNHYQVEKNNIVPASDVSYVYNSDSINGISAFQFTAGLIAEYLINDLVGIEVGAAYSKKKEVNADVNTPASDSTQSYSEYIYHYNAEYLELSGKIKYYFPLGNKKWLYAGTGGILSYNFPESAANLGYYTHLTYSDSVWVTSDKVTLQPASATFSALVVAGFQTELTNNWSLFIEPQYKYGFNPVIKHPTFDYIPVNHYWRTFSIAVGLKYGF